MGTYFRYFTQQIVIVLLTPPPREARRATEPRRPLNELFSCTAARRAMPTIFTYLLNSRVLARWEAAYHRMYVSAVDCVDVVALCDLAFLVPTITLGAASLDA